VLAGAGGWDGTALEVGRACVVVAATALVIEVIAVDVWAGFALWCLRLWALRGGSVFLTVEVVDELVEAAAVEVFCDALEPQPAMVMATAAAMVEISARLMARLPASRRLGVLRLQGHTARGPVCFHRRPG
jgi:hypothetical protein